MTEASDIDLLVVMPTKPGHAEAIDAVDDLASRGKPWTGNDVRPLVYSEDEIQPASIVDSIPAEGIDVAGDPA